MKKFTQVFITVFVAFLFQTTLNAQVSIYTFSQSIGSYNAITGGTLFGNSSNDDQVFINPAFPGGQAVGTTGPGLPIGFNFIFNGISYDRLGINTNGFIFFGQSTLPTPVNSQIGSAYAPISSTAGVQPILQQKVSAFGRDLQAKSVSSEIRMETMGLPLTRTTVIQWTNYGKYGQIGDNYNFQICLYEIGNVIEVIYGGFTPNAIPGTAQVGLRGQNVNDYNNRFVNAINTWPFSALGSAPNSIVNIDNSLFPPTGLIYRWEPAPICTGTPAANSILASLTTICPGGNAQLSLSTTYTNSGITYQWLSSNTGSNGAFSQIAFNSTSKNYSANNIPSSTWYKCAVTCTNGSATNTIGPLLVSTIGSVVSTVPYHEDFENILINNSLPNCSWAISTASICQTNTTSNTSNRIPYTGSRFASFKSGTNVNGDYFYTNALKLNAGVTYSASVWYITDGLVGWSNFSMLFSTAQSPLTLTTIATATVPINSVSYQNLSNTFTVPTSGNYFIAIKCLGNASAQFLSFDDISVTIPCQINAPAILLSPSTTTICGGQTTTITASGANSYTWTGGVTGTSISVSPTTTSTYFIIGNNTLTACSNTVGQTIHVNPSPQVNIVSSSSFVCAGKSITLNGNNADVYTWSTGDFSNSISVSPTVSTTYTLTGSNTFSCSTSVTKQVMVVENPSFTLTATPTVICVGESAELNATGSSSIEWKASTLYASGSTATVMPTLNTTYSATGTNSMGCSTTNLLTLNVETCLAINKNEINDETMRVYPNPFINQLHFSFKTTHLKLIQVFDATGRLLNQYTTEETSFTIDTYNLSTGLYYVRVNSNHKNYTYKINK